jgi:mRNA-degrading endonuclease RelE of RelBE toxin-antitoxin system
MYAKLLDLDDPNICHFEYNKYRIIYEITEQPKIIRILTLFHSKQQLKL